MAVASAHDPEVVGSNPALSSFPARFGRAGWGTCAELGGRKWCRVSVDQFVAVAGAVAYLALVNTALGYALWFRGLERLPASRVSFLGLLSPVVAASAGWLVLGQGLNAWQLLGVVLALGSLVAAQRGPAPRVNAAAGTTSPTRPPAAGSTGPRVLHPLVDA